MTRSRQSYRRGSAASLFPRERAASRPATSGRGDGVGAGPGVSWGAGCGSRGFGLRLMSRLVLGLALALGLGLGLGWEVARAQELRDQFSDREILVTGTGSLMGNNTGATVEPGEPRHGGKPGGRSLWISWIAPTNGVVRFETEGSAFDTLLSAYWSPGTNDPALVDLVELARADDSEGLEHESEIKFGVLAGQRYEIAVDGYYGASGRIEMGWVFEPTDVPPPIVLSVPPDRSVTSGAPVVLTVNFTNQANGRFRWYRNGFELGAQGPTLTLPSVHPADVGRYRLKVMIDGPDYFTIPIELQINSDDAGNVLAQDKVLDALGTALVPGAGGGGGPGAPLLFFAASQGAVSRGYNGTQIFNTTYATPDPSEPRHCDLNGGASFWYAYTPPADGTVTLDTVGSTFDTYLAVYTYDPPLTGYGGLIPIACDNDSGGAGGAARLEFAAPKSRQYLVVIDGIGGAKGLGQLNYRLDTNRPPVPPTLLEAPAVVRVPAGGNAVLQPVVAGSAPLRFTWTGVTGPIPGATNAELLLTNARPAYSGEYRVTVSSHVGGPLEIVLPLRVLTPPALQFTPDADAFRLSFPGVPGQRYRLEHTPDLNAPWELLGGPWDGDGSEIVLTNAPSGPHRFYRVRVE